MMSGQSIAIFLLDIVDEIGAPEDSLSTSR